MKSTSQSRYIEMLKIEFSFGSQYLSRKLGKIGYSFPDYYLPWTILKGEKMEKEKKMGGDNGKVPNSDLFWF